MKKVLLLEEIDQAGIDLLRHETEVQLCSDLNPENILKESRDAAAIIVRSITLNRDIIENSPALKVIGRHGAGVDNIDVEAATTRKIAVVNTPTANSQSVAEHVILSMLVIAKKALQLNLAIKQGKFSSKGSSLPRLAEKLGYVGIEIRGKTIGIIGLGKIGQIVAEICIQAFSMNILAYDPYLPSGTVDKRIKLCDHLEPLLKESDFITLHLPLTEQTRGLIGLKELSLMKNNAYIINAARGGIVEENALVKALTNKTIAGAAVDVYSDDPPPADHPFFKLDNLFTTPHVASITKDALKRMALQVSEGVLDVLNERKPKFLVNPAIFE